MRDAGVRSRGGDNLVRGVGAVEDRGRLLQGAVLGLNDDWEERSKVREREHLEQGRGRKGEDAQK